MAEENITRKLTAILYADVASYTRLTGEDEVGTHRQLSTGLDLISGRITNASGRVVHYAGDAVLAQFDSVVAALELAVEVQGDLAEIAANIDPDKRVAFRMGVNFGEVIIDRDDIYGDGVNLAARLESIADTGGVCISGKVYDEVRDKLPYGYEYLGKQRLKNIAEPVRVYKVLASAEPRTTRPRSRLNRRMTGIVGALFLLIFGGITIWYLAPGREITVADAPLAVENQKLSIVVLPFDNSSGDRDQDYFADALTEDITVDLSRISGSFVISRRTAATYRGRNMDALSITRNLKVRYLLEGNVRRARNDVLVNVQLTDGKTGQQVWAERFEKPAGDMYTFQNVVTGRVARALNLELKEALSRQAARNHNSNQDADDLALRAWAELWNKPQSRESNDAALKYANQALAIDSDHAEALGVTAYAYARAANYGWGVDRIEDLENGIAAGEKALALDSKNADSAYSLGFLHYVAGDTRISQELMRQSIELNRNHAPAYFFSGLNLIRLGRPHETEAMVKRAFLLSPRDPLRSVWYGVTSRALLLTGEEERAIEEAQKGIDANRKHGNNYAVMAAANANLGRLDMAKAALKELLRVQPGITVSRYLRRVAADDPVAIKTYERMTEGLRKAGLPE